MTVQEYLDAVLSFEQEIKEKNRTKANKRKRLKERALKITSILSDVVVLRTPDPHALQAILAEIEDLEREIDRDNSLVRQLKEKAGEKIDRIPDETLVKLLRLHYLEGKTWKAIADQLGCAEGYVYVLQKRAIEALANSERRRSVCCPALNPDAPTP